MLRLDRNLKKFFGDNRGDRLEGREMVRDWIMVGKRERIGWSLVEWIGLVID